MAIEASAVKLEARSRPMTAEERKVILASSLVPSSSGTISTCTVRSP